MRIGYVLFIVFLSIFCEADKRLDAHFGENPFLRCNNFGEARR
jgi:hypothetical protein